MKPNVRSDVRRRLEAIDEAITEIGSFTAGKTASDFTSDPLLRSAVLWQLVRICEPVRSLARDDFDIAQRINGYRDIIGFRTRLIHRYHQIRLELVWRYAQDDLPRLRENIGALLDDEAGN